MDPATQAAVNSLFVSAVEWHLMYLEGTMTAKEFADKLVVQFNSEIQFLEPAYIELTKSERTA